MRLSDLFSLNYIMLILQIKLGTSCTPISSKISRSLSQSFFYYLLLYLTYESYIFLFLFFVLFLIPFLVFPMIFLTIIMNFILHTLPPLVDLIDKGIKDLKYMYCYCQYINTNIISLNLGRNKIRNAYGRLYHIKPILVNPHLLLL